VTSDLREVSFMRAQLLSVLFFARWISSFDSVGTSVLVRSPLPGRVSSWRHKLSPLPAVAGQFLDIETVSWPCLPARFLYPFRSSFYATCCSFDARDFASRSFSADVKFGRKL